MSTLKVLFTEFLKPSNEQNSEQWRWKSNKNGLIPATTLELPAAKSFFRMQRGCSKACECGKAGLKCFFICTSFIGTCDNSQVLSQDEEEEREIVFSKRMMKSRMKRIAMKLIISSRMMCKNFRSVTFWSVLKTMNLKIPGPSRIVKHLKMR